MVMRMKGEEQGWGSAPHTEFANFQPCTTFSWGEFLIPGRVVCTSGLELLMRQWGGVHPWLSSNMSVLKPESEDV